MNIPIYYTEVESGKTVKDTEAGNKKEAKKRIKELRKNKVAVPGSIVCYVQF